MRSVVSVGSPFRKASRSHWSTRQARARDVRWGGKRRSREAKPPLGNERRTAKAHPGGWHALAHLRGYQGEVEIQRPKTRRHGL